MKRTTGNKRIAAVQKVQPKPFTIVAIGASAGGLEAVSMMLKNLPADTGMAYIYVQHLSASHKSLLTAILSKLTKMKVQEVENMEFIVPDNVYVIPHNKEIKVIDGHIQVLPRINKTSTNLSIDILFSSLAETHKENVIGIVLSGNASDGTRGLQSIKDAGGVTFAQDDSAQVASMPHAAINAGVVDFVLSPKEIAAKLVALKMSGHLKLKGKVDTITNNDPGLETIFKILHSKTGVDFSHYKISTIKRRVSYKMLQAGVSTLKNYSKLLLKQNNEADQLYKDLLINVTGFFRDAEVWRYLKTSFILKLIKGKAKSDPLRIWVPACSTGEEAYSIAILIAGLQVNMTDKIPFKIFATDLSEHAVHEARLDEYTQSAVKTILKKDLARFFIKKGDNYCISKELRETCVFATHNILQDPPFSRMDFISCRNLLIYFDGAAQKKAFATLHFALNDNGYLMLGNAETVSTSSQLFTQLNSKYKIYARRRDAGSIKIPELVSRFTRGNVYATIDDPAKKNIPAETTTIEDAIDAVLLTNYMPACAVINKDLDILQFRGSTSVYLRHLSGKASLNILKMVRPEFVFQLRTAIQKVFETEQTISRQDIEMMVEGEVQTMSVEVSRLIIEWNEPLLLIVFTTLNSNLQGHQTDLPATGNSNAGKKELRVQALLIELNAARSGMNGLLEFQEKANEELQSANEEIISANEEFQTLNEELETSKEQIEANNEELIITNKELKMQNELLKESYDYSQTIISTIHEPMLILDHKLRVKSANKSFYKKFSVRKDETEGVSLFELDDKQWKIPELQKQLNGILLRNSSLENFEVIHARPGTERKIMLLNANRIIQKAHREKLILLAIQDITERALSQLKEKQYLEKNISTHQADKLVLENEVQRRTQQLQEKNNELENANKDLLSFTYVSSHDLQEPLRKIQNFVSLIDTEKESLSEAGKHYLQRTMATATQMRELLEDLLVYSRTRDVERQFESIEIGIILSEVLKDFEDVIKKKKVIISSLKLCKANIIPFQFRQLLDNLIGNSIKFSKLQRQLRITLNSEIVKENKLTKHLLLPRVRYCHIVYTDNGIGFDKQYNERIFEVFERLHNRDEYEGTGMGLAICKRIVENHKGIITATGALHKGARFDIYIPAA